MFNWAYLDKEATPLGSFFVWILSRAQISSLTSEGFFIEVLSVAILETTKTWPRASSCRWKFYRSQFWRLQKPVRKVSIVPFCFIGHNFGDYKNLRPIFSYSPECFIGHNFGDYKNHLGTLDLVGLVLSVTILETTKTSRRNPISNTVFYRSQFWRLQKPNSWRNSAFCCFIGHNFGDYKNPLHKASAWPTVLSVAILETTKTCGSTCYKWKTFYRSQFWRLQKHTL